MNIDLRNRLEALGRPLTPSMLQASIDCFAALQPRQPPASARIERDIFYGTNERHRLDLFVPLEEPEAMRPVLLFVHGGGFVGGDKSRPNSPFYDNIGYWAVAHGCVGVTMTYRLAPQHPWPAGAEDVGHAVEWLALNVERYGGHAAKLFLMGQSAGAAHVANYIGDARFHRSAGRALAGALLVSGLYDLDAAERNEFQRAYYGTEYEKYAEYSSMSGIVATDLPLLVTISEFDPDDFQRQAAAFVSASAKRNGCYPRVLYLQGHNHLSSVLQLGTRDDTLGPEIDHFIAATCANR